MKVATLIFNPIGENTYVLWDETLECVIIDGGASTPAEQATLDNFIAEHGLKPVLAANTHGHFDHVLGVNHLKRRYEIPFACSSKDQYLLNSAAASGNVYGIPTSDMPAIDIDLATTPELKFGTTTLKVIPTPGHTPGGVTLLNETEKVAFTGDTLFRESIGRTDLEGGD
ncbi:MAG: MBL fold metallo-hydrolase, partial [Alistipes sp.]|nr:MBL fold metallo-hydrolase [Alistipes sp.]